MKAFYWISCLYYFILWVGLATELRAGRSGIESRWGTRFSARPDRPWGSPSLL